MKKVSILLIVLFSFMGLNAETPNEASKAILDLIKKEDFTTLFKTRYSEIHKAKPEEVDSVIASLSKYFKKDKAKLIAVYEQLVKAKFEEVEYKHAQKTETGKKVKAPVMFGKHKGSFYLYEMKSGLWGFHM